MTDPKPETLDMAGLAALAAQAGPRIQSFEVGGRKVWVKRAARRRKPGHHLQALMSLGLPGSIYRPAPAEVGDAASRGEARRLRQFQAKGIDVPELLFEGPGVLILGDCGLTIEARLRLFRDAGQMAAHDDLLVAMARSLAAVHALGLVHGRPHPRDMFVREGRIGFMDFEQDPLRAMSLVRAQARDALFLFGFVCDMAVLPETPMRAWEAWSAHVPAAVPGQLAATLKGMKALVLAGRLVSRIRQGSDLRRFLAGTGFLCSVLEKSKMPENYPVNMQAQVAQTAGETNGNDHHAR